MLFLSPEDLEIQGVSYKGASKIIFNNTILTRCIDFSIHCRERAIKFCQECLDDNIFCLIVETQSYLTVWVEDKEVRLADETEILRNYVGREPTVLSVHAKDKDDASVKAPLKFTTALQAQTTMQVLFPKKEKSCDSNSIQEGDEFDTPSLPQPPTEDKAPTKKRIRKYRGIPY